MSEIAVYPKKPISLESFPDLVEVTTPTKAENSLYLSIGLGFLRNMIRFKAYPNLLSHLSNSLKQAIAESQSLAAQLQLTQDLGTFEKTYEILSTNPNRIESMNWLEKYVSGEYPDATRAIVRTAQILACGFLLEKGFQTNGVFTGTLSTDENTTVMQGFAFRFSTHFRLIWETGTYTYEIPGGTTGYIISLYFSNDFYSLLGSRDERAVDINVGNVNLPADNAFLYTPLHQESHESQEIVEEVKRESEPEQDMYKEIVEEEYNPGIVGVAVDNHVDAEEDYSNPAQGTEVCRPLLASLISAMAKEIIENKIFSKEIQTAFNNALEEFPQIADIPGMDEMSRISERFCEKHPDTESIIMFCKRKHCKFCIYDIIIKNITTANFKIYCSCGAQIPPKDIVRMKDEESYQQYRNNQKN